MGCAVLWVRLCHPPVWLSQGLAGALVGHLRCCWQGLVPVHELCPRLVPGGCSWSGRVKPTGVQVLITQKFTGTSERPCCSAADLDPRQLAPGCFRSRYHTPWIRSKSLHRISSKTLPSSSALTEFRTSAAALTVGQKASGDTGIWLPLTFLARGSSLEEDCFQELFPCPLT